MKSDYFRKGWTSTIMVLAIFVFGACTQEVKPVLEFPEAGLDDAETYRGYTTRFFQDSAENTLQIYIKESSGRVVNLWADAANESISFTARDSAGQPVNLAWGSAGAQLSSDGKTRYVEYSLSSPLPSLDVGHFLLNTMRLERDFQYLQQHLLPFDSEPPVPEELTGAIEKLQLLPAEIRGRHLALLNADSLGTLRSRLSPQVRKLSESRALVEATTFDGLNHLSLEVGMNGGSGTLTVSKNKISFRSGENQPVEFSVKIATDSPALTPIRSADIFNPSFFEFFERSRSKSSFKRLERQIKSMELVSSREKLVAGLPNYATYFGRDMMMSALMLEPVLKPEMLEHVVASVLKKLHSTGEVSHEEGLGGQAIRENIAKYNQLISDYLQQEDRNNSPADELLAQAETMLADLQAVTENYHMVDDDFQLPVLAARYLTSPAIPDDRKHEFLQSRIRPGADATHLDLLLANLAYVARVSRPYAEKPVTANLISFRQLGEHHWHAGSWRDSSVGYAGGRYAMDINAIWVPKALVSVAEIMTALRELGISTESLADASAEAAGRRLADYASNPESLQSAINTWTKAERHFEVHLTAVEVRQRVTANLGRRPARERAFWQDILIETGIDQSSVDFLAIALDEDGQPIPVAHTDIATWLFLDNSTEKVLSGDLAPEDVLQRLSMFVLPHPVGLFVFGVGPLVSNDVFASPEVWEKFEKDLYHSPRVVWGREVNLLFLGLAKQIQAAYDSEGQLKDKKLESYVNELRAILRKVLFSVEASGLKHNELWSYRIEPERVLPARYSTTTDIQLWNLTDLAVQFLLETLRN